MSVDFVARLVSRALVPGEVTSQWTVPDYVNLLVPHPDAEARAEQLVRRQARARRRIDVDRMRDVLGALASPPGQELNHADLARRAGMPATTIGPYVHLLYELGALQILGATRATVAKRVVARPRAFMSDLRMATYLADVPPQSLLDFAGRSRLAPYLRAMVCLELIRQQPSSPVSHRVGYLRERNGLAVDVVIELPDGAIFGVEVRTAGSIRPHQFAGLEALAVRAGARFRGGVVLNTAQAGARYRPGLWSLPISTVWEDESRLPTGYGFN